MFEMLEEVPSANRHVLLPEGGCCTYYPEGGCRVVLAVGTEAAGGTGLPEGVALREEVLACLYAALLARSGTRLRRDCRLYRLACGWPPTGHGAGGRPGAAGAGALPDVLVRLGRLWLVRPEGAFALAVGDNPDDAARLVALVGVEEGTGDRHAFLWGEPFVERLWRTLLLGPGACFSSPGGPLWDADRQGRPPGEAA